MKQKSVGLTLRAVILALVLSLVAGTPALPPLEGVAYAQSSGLVATVAPGNNSVGLTWTAVTGADSYEIWRGEVVNNNAQWGNSAYDTVDAPAVTYTDDDVTAGKTYAYAVRSVTGGTPAAWTGPYPNVTIPGGTAAPTDAPTVTVAADGNTAVDVSWTTVSGATGYEIWFWHAGLGNSWSQISVQTSPYKHTGLTPGTQYYYQVRGVNAGGEGPLSNWRTDDSQVTLQATTDVPELTLTRINRTTARLDWTPTGEGAEYELQRRKITTDSATPTANEVEGDWGRLALQAETTYTDSAANYVPAADAVFAIGPVGAKSVKYEYRVKATDSQGVSGDWSKVKDVSVPAAGAVLPAPAIGASTVSATSIQVSWNAIAGAEFYQLRWKSGDRSYSSPIRVDKPDSGRPLYNHPGLSPSTKYTYQVRAVDINGASDWSGAKSATTLGTTDTAGQMPKVTGLTVTDTTQSNTSDLRSYRLTWNAVSGATHYDLQQFDPDTSAGWTDFAGNAGRTLRIAKAVVGSPPTYNGSIASGAAGKTYHFIVSAVDVRPDGDADADAQANDDLGEWSDYKTVTFKAHKPNTPTGLDAEKTSGSSILVTWRTGGTAPEGGESRGEPSSYTLQWRTSQTSDWSTISGASSPYHHTGLSGNTTYHYRVGAENSGGVSDYTTSVSEMLGHTLARPTGLKTEDATTGTTPRIKISWSRADGADSYEIQRWSTTRNAWTNLAGDAANTSGVFPATEVPTARGTSVTDDGDDALGVLNTTVGTLLSAGTTYYYRVRSVQETVTTSDWSAIVTGTTKSAKLDTPALLATTTGQSMIRLSWKSVSDATMYELQFAEGEYTSADTSGGLGFSGVNRTTITVAGSFSHYVHTGRNPGTQYSYRLRALGANDVKSDWSANSVQPFTKPAQPQLSAVEPTADSIKLKWDAVKFTGSATAGRLRAVANYRIERRASGVTTWDELVASLVCDGNDCSFTDIGLDDGTTYFYRIRAEVPDQNVRLGSDNAETVTYTSYWDYANQRTPAE